MENQVLPPLQQRLDSFRRQDRVRAGSLIITGFGDAVLPRGSRIWLGSLIRLLEPLAVNERLIRTSVFRLAKEGWLRSERSGRRTDYLLTAAGQRRFEAASRHIYAAAAPSWDRRWRIIVTIGELTPKERESLRRALFWQGFGALGGGSFVHPSADLRTAFDALLAEGLTDVSAKLKPLIAADAQLGGAASDADMVRAAWNLPQMGGVYGEFTARYQPILAQLRDGRHEVDDESAFLLRVLLIHDYRRLLLRDPVLPDVLLPAQWAGQEARLLCKELYRRLLPASERHLDRHLRLASGDTPAASPALLERFRDVDPLAEAA